MRKPRGRLACALVLFASAPLAACKTTEKPPPEPIAAPRVATAVRYQLGGPLRGPDAGAPVLADDAFEPAKTLDLELTLFALPAPLAHEGEPLLADVSPIVSRARLVVDESPFARPLRVTPHALASARAGPLASPEALLAKLPALRGRKVREARACLVGGATAVFEVFRDLAAPGEGEPEAEPGRARVALLCSRRADGSGIDLALEFDEEAGAGAQAAPRSELLALDAASSWKPAQTAWAFLLPSPFHGEEARELVLVARSSVPPPATAPGAVAHAEAVAQARRDLSAQLAQASRALSPPAPPPDLPDLALACRALEDRKTSRRALFTLALATGARTAEEVALAVDDETLAPISSTVAAALALAPDAHAPRAVGLAVEKACLAACRELLSGDEPPDELLSALERRGGAALRLLVSLHAELDRAKTLEALDEQILLENLQLLEDASPLVRVRAARWLAARIDLRDYDALGEASRRRDLVKAIRQALAQAQGKKP